MGNPKKAWGSDSLYDSTMGVPSQVPSNDTVENVPQTIRKAPANSLKQAANALP